MDKVLAGKEDLAYDLAVEVMPEFEPMDVSKLKPPAWSTRPRTTNWTSPWPN